MSTVVEKTILHQINTLRGRGGFFTVPYLLEQLKSVQGTAGKHEHKRAEGLALHGFKAK